MRRIFISPRKLLTLTKQFMKSYNRKHKKKRSVKREIIRDSI